LNEDVSHYKPLCFVHIHYITVEDMNSTGTLNGINQIRSTYHIVTVIQPSATPHSNSYLECTSINFSTYCSNWIIGKVKGMLKGKHSVNVQLYQWGIEDLFIVYSLSKISGGIVCISVDPLSSFPDLFGFVFMYLL
jgi:hypothetical protein